MEGFQLDRRTYKYKSPHMKFLCPLCRTERYFSMGPRLTTANYVQMSLITVVITLFAWPLTGWKGIFSFFMVWAVFEFWRRLLFKKEIPCPHCGFDASWYKRDVKKARQLVKDFWAKQNPTTTAEQKNPEQVPQDQEASPIMDNQAPDSVTAESHY